MRILRSALLAICVLVMSLVGPASSSARDDNARLPPKNGAGYLAGTTTGSDATKPALARTEMLTGSPDSAGAFTFTLPPFVSWPRTGVLLEHVTVACPPTFGLWKNLPVMSNVFPPLREIPGSPRSPRNVCDDQKGVGIGLHSCSRHDRDGRIPGWDILRDGHDQPVVAEDVFIVRIG